jgi:hypothetical protein
VSVDRATSVTQPLMTSAWREEKLVAPPTAAASSRRQVNHFKVTKSIEFSENLSLVRLLIRLDLTQRPFKNSKERSLWCSPEENDSGSVCVINMRCSRDHERT